MKTNNEFSLPEKRGTRRSIKSKATSARDVLLGCSIIWLAAGSIVAPANSHASPHALTAIELQQQVSLRGTVVTNDGQPLQGVSIFIAGRSAAATDQNGQFELSTTIGSAITFFSNWI